MDARRARESGARADAAAAYLNYSVRQLRLPRNKPLALSLLISVAFQQSFAPHLCSRSRNLAAGSNFGVEVIFEIRFCAVTILQSVRPFSCRRGAFNRFGFRLQQRRRIRIRRPKRPTGATGPRRSRLRDYRAMNGVTSATDQATSRRTRLFLPLSRATIHGFTPLSAERGDEKKQCRQ